MLVAKKKNRLLHTDLKRECLLGIIQVLIYADIALSVLQSFIDESLQSGDPVIIAKFKVTNYTHYSCIDYENAFIAY